MSIIEVKVMPAPEAAAYLRSQLGPIVAWDAHLADLRRGKALPLADFDLQPCAHVKARCRRPMYAIHDLAVFVLSVRRRYPEAGPGIKPQVCTIEIDTDDPRDWKMKPPALTVSHTFAVT
jgi:hypothetical protein